MKKLYVWQNTDDGYLEIFNSLKKAKDYSRELYPDDEDEWEDGSDGRWTKNYESIHRREIRE